MSFSTPRAAIMAVFAAFGALVGTFAGSVPQVISHYGLNNASYGIGVTVMTIATVAATGISGWLARHVAHRHLLLAVVPASFLLVSLLMSGTSAPVFFAAIALCGVALGITDMIMNAEGGHIEVSLGRPVYTAFHGSASLSGAVFSILSSWLSTRYGTTAALAAAFVVVAAATVLVWRNIAYRRLEVEPAIARQRAKLSSHFTLPLVLIGIAAGLIIACEIAALFWSSKLLAEMAPELAAVSGLGAAFFSLCNAVVRFPGDSLRGRFGDVPLMRATILVAIAGFLGLALSDGFAANVVFFAMTGMGVALLCPCLFAMAARQTPANRAAGLSVSMLIAGVPRMVAPVTFGAIAEGFSIRLAFGLCVVMLLAALAAILFLGKHQRRS